MGGKISKEELKILRQNTNFSDKEIRRWHTGFMKECPSGRLNREQCSKVFKVLFPETWSKRCPNGDIDALSRHLFRSLDRDQTGFINFHEFLESIDVVLNGTLPAKLTWLFELFDIDRNGTIEAEELESIIGSVYEMMGGDVSRAKEDSEEIFRQIDVDGDKHISKREFIKACASNRDMYELLTNNLI